MHTMKEQKQNPVIRVRPETRRRLKVLAAQQNKTMQDYLEWLVSYAVRYDEEMREQMEGMQREKSV